MIEKIPDQISLQTGEWRGTTFDIIPKETFVMACRKINELIGAVNELQMKVGHMEDGVVCEVFDNTNSKTQRDLEIAIDALNKIALVDDAGAQMVATAREALTKIGNITPR